jgi:hypothetical protein
MMADGSHLRSGGEPWGAGVARQCSRNRCLARWTDWIPHRGRGGGAGRANSKKDLVTDPIRGFCALQAEEDEREKGSPHPHPSPLHWHRLIRRNGLSAVLRRRDRLTHGYPALWARRHDSAEHSIHWLSRTDPPVGPQAHTRRRTSRLKGSEVARRDEFTDSVDTRRLSKPARRGYGYGERYSFL